MKQDAHSQHAAALLRLQPKPDPAATVVIALLPLSGVLALDWSVPSVFGFYWIESVFIGLCHWLKLLAARGSSVDPRIEQHHDADATLTAQQRLQRIEPERQFQHRILPGGFLALYGMFCAAHVAIIVILFDGAFAELGSVLGLVTLGAIAATQARDYVRFRADPARVALPRYLLFLHPFKRVIVLQLVLLVGAIPVKLGYPLLAAFLLTAIKLASELVPWGRRRT